MKARIYITLKETVLDPQGTAVRHSLHSLGFLEVQSVRQGKVIDLELHNHVTPELAQEQLHAMCEQLLANTVIEEYRVELL